MKAISVLFALAALIPPALVGQGPRDRPGAAPPLEIGSALPDLVAFDEGGEEFPLRQKLKGRHAVIVFGCLT